MLSKGYRMFIFCILGISSLIGWNAVLSSFNFFAQDEIFGPKVFSQFTIPLQVANCLVGALMPLIAEKVSILMRVAGGMGALSVLMMFLPIIAEYYHSDIGYGICLAITFFIGGFNSLAQNSMVVLAGMEEPEVNAIYWTATGLSGLTMAVLAIVLAASIPHNLMTQTVIFFIVACLISILAMFLTWQYTKDKENEIADDQSEANKQLLSEDANQKANFEDAKSFQTNDDSQIIAKDYENVEEQQKTKPTFFDDIKIALKHAKYLPVFVWLIYITTFTVFPGLSMSDVNFKTNFLAKNHNQWGILFLNLTFQIGDVSGKYTSGATMKPKHETFLYILTTCRLVFIVTSELLARGTIVSDWFPYVNMFLMASTNGFTTGGLMSIFPTKASEGKIISTMGFICVFALTFGIACGAIISPLAEIHLKK